MKQLRVLYVRNARGITDLTGGETYLLSLFSGLDPRHCKCLLACISDPRNGETRWLRELKQRNLPFVDIPVGSPISIKDVVEVTKLAREFEADIIHSIDHRADIVAVLAARMTGRAAIASFFGWTNWEAGSTRGMLYPWLDRRALRYADAIISDSAFIGRLVDQGPGGPPLIVVPQGVDLRNFDPDSTSESLKRRFFDEDGIQLLGMIGRIHPNKGQLDFVRAAALLQESHPSARFVILGEAPAGYADYRSKVEALIREKKLENIVRITNVLREEVPAALASMDVVLAPSYIESFSFVLLESMAMRKPVVATRVGGNPEMIKDGELNELVPAGDWEALALAAGALLDDPERRELLGRLGRRKIETELNLSVMSERTLSVYREVLDRRRRNRGRFRTKRKLRERLTGRS